jgi:hypothetical protein
MKNSAVGPRTQWRRRLLQGLNLLAILVGLKFGYDFGLEINGVLLGVFLAGITALFATLVVDVLSSWFDRPASPEAGAGDSLEPTRHR